MKLAPYKGVDFFQFLINNNDTYRHIYAVSGDPGVRVQEQITSPCPTKQESSHEGKAFIGNNTRTMIRTVGSPSVAPFHPGLMLLVGKRRNSVNRLPVSGS